MEDSVARRARPVGRTATATPNRKPLFNRLIGLFGVKPGLADALHYTQLKPGELRQHGMRRRPEGGWLVRI